MKKALLILTIILYLIPASKAQDPHFSQFFASPLTLNPAFTGLFSGDYRIAGNYRSQWRSIATPYITGTLSADFSILKNVISYTDIWGVGIMALYDKTGGGALVSNYIAISTSYHKGLDPEGNHTLAIGLQGAWMQKRVDQSKLMFENQIDNNGYNPGLPSNEFLTNPKISYFDPNVGILYNGLVGEASNIYLGASYYHITQPTETFMSQDNNRLSYRYTIHGGGSFPVNGYNRIHASALYMKQSTASETSFGAAYGFNLSGVPEDNPTMFYLGSWYRLKDAINPYVGLEIAGFTVGLTYDLNVSSLKPASNYRGGMEISVIYVHRSNENSKYKTLCPKF
ncbi:MAG TPA: PorP/SprF family type IX secretion system membrane protein [Chitinophaga sp.]|jgi:type IX secretion system PorP/SprF family membrane protein|uniref:PorP/SprF family type IX secretion system membrane protein n=1 Tax=Chitinophaga sp. TaxID=1869181 RepID=UPI002DB9FD3C|nr:PorP/SprF family type IX secretion system membrane protein [Chitinophaga sp.]HEU4552602.1 PorP/SprF family type IX secretion system membrane protein [Chitinophaga sp.]